MNELQALVLRRLAELGDSQGPLPARTAAERSRGRVSYETLRAIARGAHSGRLSDRIAEGLSIALDVPIAEIYSVARIPRPQSRWLWPERFDRLDMAQRRIVEDVASGFLEAYERGLRDAQ